MKDFSNAIFSPDTVSIMKDAMDAAVANCQSHRLAWTT
jgi:hypothetical protein